MKMTAEEDAGSVFSAPAVFGPACLSKKFFIRIQCPSILSANGADVLI